MKFKDALVRCFPFLQTIAAAVADRQTDVGCPVKSGTASQAALQCIGNCGKSSTLETAAIAERR